MRGRRQLWWEPRSAAQTAALHPNLWCIRLREGDAERGGGSWTLAPAAGRLNPKTENRRKSEFRSPNHLALWQDSNPLTEVFVRISVFGLPSDFGLRPSGFKLAALAKGASMPTAAHFLPCLAF
jgi:hypothetical protein